MAQFETWLKSDLKKPVEVVKLKGNLFSADNEGNLIGVEVMDDGSPATLSGEVQGYVIRDDNYTVFIEGTLENNKASIVLPLSCYSIVGPISIVIKVGETTVGACCGYVYRSTTDAYVDPAHVIPTLAELLAQIDACIEATGDANEAAEKIDNMTVAATGLAYNANPTATISEVSGHKHIAFGIPGGTPATIKTQTDYYQNSSSGTVIPSGEWSTTQPTTPQGSFLWVKHHVVWYDDTETDVYSVSRQGVDGSGSVSSILLGSNQLSPDASGQITLPIDNAPTADSGNLVLSGALQSLFSALNSKSIKIYDAPSSANPIDLNDVRSLSFVYATISSKAYLSNKPADIQCYVFTVGNGTRCVQYCYDIDNSIVYNRSRGGSNWGDWCRIPSWEELTLGDPSNTPFSNITYEAYINKTERMVYVRLSGTTTEAIGAHVVKQFKTISSSYAPSVAAFGTAEFIDGSDYHVASLRKNSSTMIAYQCNEQTPSGVTVNGTIMWKY